MPDKTVRIELETPGVKSEALSFLQAALAFAFGFAVGVAVAKAALFLLVHP
jgi:hypothetical protein